MAVPFANDRVTFRLAHADDDMLVVEKRAKLVTVPGVGHDADTLLNGLMAHYGPRLAKLGAKRDWGMLHRLDRGRGQGHALDRLRPRHADAAAL